MVISVPQVETQYVLSVVDPHFTERVIPLEGFPATLGRGDEVEICINDQWVSQVHCRIDTEHDELIIEDLGSQYGTEVNGHLVHRQVLHPGDHIRVGLSEFELKLETAD